MINNYYYYYYYNKNNITNKLSSEFHFTEVKIKKKRKEKKERFVSALRAEQWFEFHSDGGQEDRVMNGGILMTLRSFFHRSRPLSRPVFPLCTRSAPYSSIFAFVSHVFALSLSLSRAPGGGGGGGQCPWQVLQQIGRK